MIQTLETNDLIIRPFTQTDIKSVYQLSQEPSLAKWIPDQVYSGEKEAADVVSFLISQYQDQPMPNQRPFVLALKFKKTKELIGHVGLSPLRGEVEIGYAVAEKQCGKGYATQAVTAISNWAISNLGIQMISGIVACENVGSFRVLEKSGYRLELESDLQYLGKLRRCRKYLFASRVF